MSHLVKNQTVKTPATANVTWIPFSKKDVARNSATIIWLFGKKQYLAKTLLTRLSTKHVTAAKENMTREDVAHMGLLTYTVDFYLHLSLFLRYFGLSDYFKFYFGFTQLNNHFN